MMQRSNATRRGSQPRHRASPPPLTPQAPSRRLRLTTTRLWLVLGFERPEDVAGTAPRAHQLGIIAEPIPHHPVERALPASSANHHFHTNKPRSLIPMQVF